MRNLKRVLSLALALVMVLGMMVIGTSAATYADADEITYTEAVDVMTALEVLEGDGTNYNPKDILDREEAATIITKMLMGKENAKKLTGSGTFTDVAADRWSAGYIDYCASLDILAGNGDGTYTPDGKLTGVAFAKMLLVALGYDPAVEGYVNNANWATNISTDAIAVGLDVKGVLLADYVTREVAAQMALQALEADMVKYASKGTSVTINGAEIVTGATAAEVIPEGDYVNYDKTARTTAGLQFVEKYFPKLTKEAGNDDAYGRPSAYSWVLTTTRANVVYEATYTPVLTYTSGFDAKEVKALEDAGYDFSNTVIEVNGDVVQGGGAIANIDTLAGREYTSVGIELFNTNTDPDTIEKAVVVVGYLSKVTSIVSGNVNPALNYITLAVYSPWDIDSDDAGADVAKMGVKTFYDNNSTIPSNYDKLVAKYKVNDYLITYWQEADLISPYNPYIGEEAVTTEVATIESTKYETAAFNGTFVASGKTYTLASAYAEYTGVGGALTLGKEYTLYLDANGCVIGAVLVTAAPTPVHYGIVLDYQYGNGVSASNMTGAAAVSAFEKVKLFTDAGTVAILDTAFVTADDGVTITTLKATGLTDSDPTASTANPNSNVLVEYTLNAAGKIDYLAVASSTGGLGGADHTKGNTFKVVGTGTAYADDKTVIFVVDKDASPVTGIGDIAVYTGYTNVPSATTSLGEQYTAGKALAANPATGRVGAVSASITVIPGSTTVAQYIVLKGAPTVTAGVKTGEFRWTYDAVLNGQTTTVFAEGTSDALTSIFDVAAGNLASVTFNATTGAVATLDAAVIDVDQINTVNSGFYNDDAVVYTDENTVYYKVTGTIAKSGSTVTGITANTITNVEVADGITLANRALGQTFQVYEYVVAGTGSVESPAKAVFYFVYQP